MLDKRGIIVDSEALEQDRNKRIAEIEATYRQRFSDSFAAFSRDADPVDGLMIPIGPSGYLMHMGGCRFGVDLHVSAPWMLPQVSDLLVSALKNLDFMVLSHAHRDHFDTAVIHALAETEATLILPSFFAKKKLRDKFSFPEERIVYLAEGETISFERAGKTLTMTAFPASHTDPDGSHAVKEYGYLFSDGTHTVFHPVDIRTYSTELFPPCDSPDTMLLHVWLGRKNARNFPCEPLLSELCAFATHYRPKQILFGHLYELSRNADSMWTDEHLRLIEEKLCELLPQTRRDKIEIGKVYCLFSSCQREASL